MIKYISVEFNELSGDKQEELIEEVSSGLLEDWKKIGKKYITDKKWHVAPKTWQEAFCRIEDIDCEMWNDLDENEDEFQKYDWKYAVEEYAEKQAEEKLYSGFHHLEVEVEI